MKERKKEIEKKKDGGVAIRGKKGKFEARHRHRGEIREWG